MTSWTTYKLSEVCNKIGSGATPKGGKSAYISEGISLIRSQNVLDFTFTEDGLAFINGAQAKALTNVEVHERDVLVNITGDSVARVCQVPSKYLPARVNQHVAILRVDTSKLSPEFLKYSLLTKYTKDRLLSLASIGATRNALTKGMLEEFEISAPEDVAVQNHIAEILSALDDKIELNRRMNQTLEHIAQTLFRQYFVDGIDEENLPDGWRVGKVCDVILQSKNSFNPSKEPDKVYLHYSIPAFDNTQRPNEEQGHTILSNKYIVKSNSILFSKLNPRFPRVWNIEEVDESRAICSTELLVFIPKAPEWYSFAYLLLSSEEVQNDLVGKATGTSGSHQRVKPSEILELGSIIPPKDIVIEFEIKLRPFLQKKQKNLVEIATLSKTRDTLLPKLMSGEIDVMHTKPEDQHEPVLS